MCTGSQLSTTSGLSETQKVEARKLTAILKREVFIFSICSAREASHFNQTLAPNYRHNTQLKSNWKITSQNWLRVPCKISLSSSQLPEHSQAADQSIRSLYGKQLLVNWARRLIILFTAAFKRLHYHQLNTVYISGSWKYYEVLFSYLHLQMKKKYLNIVTGLINSWYT